MGGGGAYIEGSATFTGCSITDNAASVGGGLGNCWAYGGGVYVSGESTFTDCSIANNSLDACPDAWLDEFSVGGGGAYIEGSATFTSCSITDNAASVEGSGRLNCWVYGVGVYANDKTVFVDCAIKNNQASCSIFSQEELVNAHAAGVGVYGGASFTRCKINENSASVSGVLAETSDAWFNVGIYGAGVYAKSAATFMQCEINGNRGNASADALECDNVDGSVGVQGAGVYVGSTATFTQCAISENKAYANCRAYSADGSEETDVDASSKGLGVYVGNAATFYNSIVASNRAENQRAYENDISDTGTIKAYNTLSGFTNWDNADEEGVVNYLYDPGLPLWNDATNGDYSLARSSQALNKGADAYAVDAQGNPPATDLAGNARFVGTVDLGPYELPVQTDARETPSTVVTTSADVVDFYDGNITLREAILYAETTPSLGGVVTFDASLKGATIVLNGTELVVTKGVAVDASSLYDAENDVPGISVYARQQSRVFYIVGGTDEKPVELNGLKIFGGRSALKNGSVNGLGYLRGGGAYVEGTTKFTRCVITGNKVEDGLGGGVYIDAGKVSFVDCAITDNLATSDKFDVCGGGVCVMYNGTSEFIGCAIAGNTAETSGSYALAKGGGVYFYNYYANRYAGMLVNCVISGNKATANEGTQGNGGAFYADGAVEARHCAILGNVASGDGGGVYNWAGAVTLYNSIVVQNASTYGTETDIGRRVKAYNTLSSHTAWSNASESGVTNYVYDASLPLFADAANGDYALVAGSQAINKGNDAYAVDAQGNALTTDLSGNARFVGTVDLGPYEYQQSTAISLASVSLSGATQVGETLTATVSPSGATATYRWYRGTSTSDMTEISGATSSTYALTEADAGYYVQVVATGFGDYTGSVSKATSTVVVAPETPSLLVTTNADVVDATDGALSLREAIQAAEAGDTITFAPSLKGATITLSGTELAIVKGITVDASSLYDAANDVPGLTLNANGKSRVFNVSGGTTETPVELIGLTITGGSSASYGGGVYVSGVLEASYCRVIGNVAASLCGGGVCVESGGTGIWTNCSFVGNTAAQAGGGYYAKGTNVLTNVLIANNVTTSTYGGGGFYAYLGTATLYNCTIAGNYTGASGGGVVVDKTIVKMHNTIVAQNTAKSSGADFSFYGSGASNLSAYNVLSSYTSWSNASESGVANYVYDASLPLFADAANGDYALAVNSQAINKGNDAYAVDAEGNALQTDLAGNARFSGSSVDLGPYEYTSPSVAPEAIWTIGDVSAAFGETVEIDLAQYFNEGDWTCSVKVPTGEGDVSATLQPSFDYRDPLVYRRFEGVSCDVDSSQVELLGSSAAAATDVVSEAFAELFVEEDAEDDFWFEFEKALGKRR